MKKTERLFFLHCNGILVELHPLIIKIPMPCTAVPTHPTLEKPITNQTRKGNRYQVRNNFDVTSFRHQLISSSFSSSRSNCDVISFGSDMGTNGPMDQQTNKPTDQRTNGPTDQQTNGPMDQRTNGPMVQQTNGPTDQRTNQRTNIVSYRGATSRLKTFLSCTAYLDLSFF
jgi:hypothetical protein